MSYATRTAASAAVWGLGDFVAQFYAAHKAAAKRRAHGEKRQGARPSRRQMLEMLDKERLTQSVAFGGVVGAASLQYQRIVPRVFGPLSRNSKGCLFALGAQQLMVTPLLLWAFFNTMTAVRGGLSDPSFMAARTVGAHGRHDVWSVERCIIKEIIPYPLLCSWGVFIPVYLFAYFGPLRGASFLTCCCAIPLCGLLSHTQSTELL